LVPGILIVRGGTMKWPTAAQAQPEDLTLVQILQVRRKDENADYQRSVAETDQHDNTACRECWWERVGNAQYGGIIAYTSSNPYDKWKLRHHCNREFVDASWAEVIGREWQSRAWGCERVVEIVTHGIPRVFPFKTYSEKDWRKNVLINFVLFQPQWTAIPSNGWASLTQILPVHLSNAHVLHNGAERGGFASWMACASSRQWNDQWISYGTKVRHATRATPTADFQWVDKASTWALGESAQLEVERNIMTSVVSSFEVRTGDPAYKMKLAETPVYLM